MSPIQISSFLVLPPEALDSFQSLKYALQNDIRSDVVEGSPLITPRPDGRRKRLSVRLLPERPPLKQLVIIRPHVERSTHWGKNRDRPHSAGRCCLVLYRMTGPGASVERRPLLRGGPAPMETKSRLKVTAGRDPGLPPSASSVERASPPRLPLPWHLHTALRTGQISNPSPECHGMLHERLLNPIIPHSSPVGPRFGRAWKVALDFWSPEHVMCFYAYLQYRVSYLQTAYFHKQTSNGVRIEIS